MPLGSAFRRLGRSATGWPPCSLRLLTALPGQLLRAQPPRVAEARLRWRRRRGLGLAFLVLRRFGSIFGRQARLRPGMLGKAAVGAAITAGSDGNGKPRDGGPQRPLRGRIGPASALWNRIGLPCDRRCPEPPKSAGRLGGLTASRLQKTSHPSPRRVLPQALAIGARVCQAGDQRFLETRSQSEPQGARHLQVPNVDLAHPGGLSDYPLRSPP